MTPPKLITVIAVCAMLVPAHADRGRRTEKNLGNRAGKITICHWSKEDSKFVPITVSLNSLDAHLPHGDCVIDDDLDCTTDTCDAEFGCINLPDDSVCDDGNLCTSDECIPGVGCVHTSAPCSDGIDCTHDACDPATGACVSTPDDSACDNGLFCDGEETCNPEVGCVAGVSSCVVACDDLCHTAGCDEVEVQCVQEPR